jgi:purine-binding chemotaxis protein CheW
MMEGRPGRGNRRITERLAVTTAEELRRDFDASFARARAEDPGAMEDLIAIRVATNRYAIRIPQITGMLAQLAIARVPSPMPELLGLTQFRGALIPVYGLGAFLGHGASPGDPRWMLTHGDAEGVGLAFDDFEGRLKIPAAEVHRAGPGEAFRDHIAGAIRHEATVRAIVDLPSILRTIERRLGRGAANQEA